MRFDHGIYLFVTPKANKKGIFTPKPTRLTRQINLICQLSFLTRYQLFVQCHLCILLNLLNCPVHFIPLKAIKHIIIIIITSQISEIGLETYGIM